MTVQNQTITAGEYSGNDVADTFNFTWGIEDKNQVIVIQTDNTDPDLPVQTTLIVDTDYFVDGIGEEEGGQIILANPLPSDFTLFMRSNFLPTQLTDFDSQGAFLPENHENAFDKLTRLIQQLIYNDDLTLQFNSNVVLTNFNPSLPAPNVSLGYLRLKEDLTGMEWVTNQGGLDLTENFNFEGDLTVNNFPVLTIENIAGAAVPPVDDANAAIQLIAAHQGAGLVTTSASAVAVTVEDFATEPFPVGAVIPIYQAGTGQVTVVAGANVTIEYKATEGLKISEQFGFASLWQRAQDVWVISGSLTL